MKFISWNVNGLRACVQKGFLDFFNSIDADFFCIQESKLQAGQIDLDLPGYHQYWNYAEKKGYSGTAIFAKNEPLSVSYGIGIEEHDREGRVITLEYDNFYLVTCYTPNSQNELKRLPYRMQWEDDFRESLNAHLMPVGVHAFNHLDIVYKILDENMSVREVYDINSVQDWRTQKHTAGWTPENVLCIFPRKNLPNEAKLPVRNVSCAKKDRFPLRYFRLGWMRVSVDKFALPQNRRTIIVRLVINLL